LQPYLNVKYFKYLAGTDSYFFREIGIPAYGFTPLNFTPILLHDHNERIHEDSLIKGNLIYEKLIAKLSNVTD
jgi:aminoacylase